MMTTENFLDEEPESSFYRLLEVTGWLAQREYAYQQGLITKEFLDTSSYRDAQREKEALEQWALSRIKAGIALHADHPEMELLCTFDNESGIEIPTLRKRLRGKKGWIIVKCDHLGNAQLFLDKLRCGRCGTDYNLVLCPVCGEYTCQNCLTYHRHESQEGQG